MKKYRIAAIQGDGIGKEVVPEGIRVNRILRYAFETASKRTKKQVTSATKSIGITITMPFRDERFKTISAEYPLIKTNQFHIDILTAHFVQHPNWFDVVVGSNLFGDILSDLGPASHPLACRKRRGESRLAHWSTRLSRTAR